MLASDSFLKDITFNIMEPLNLIIFGNYMLLPWQISLEQQQTSVIKQWLRYCTAGYYWPSPGTEIYSLLGPLHGTAGNLRKASSVCSFGTIPIPFPFFY